MFGKLIREPLVHFLLLGVLLFAAYAHLNPEEGLTDRQITVESSQIKAMVQRFERVWQREPSKDELDGLIENFVLEEIYYREALAIGLDENDPVIRRRLRQKMELLSESLGNQQAPSDAQLIECLKSHPEKFRRDARYTFKQVFVNSDIPSGDLERRLEQMSSALQSDDNVKGDQSLLAFSYDNIDAANVERTFGRGFHTKLDKTPLKRWSEPLASGIGFHFIYMLERQPASLPALDEVRRKVEREWHFDNAQAIEKIRRKSLLANYQVQVVDDVIKP